MSLKAAEISHVINSIRKASKSFARPFVSEYAEIIKDPFTTLISCILSLRTKDDVTGKASIRLFSKYPTPQLLAKAAEKEVSALIYPVGFYNIKTKAIIRISKELINRYDGKVPDDYNELLRLKGVGKKTAAITMVFGHKSKEFIPVDTHVHRISNRLGWISTKAPDESMEALMDEIPKRFWPEINELFVQFGQNICHPVSPFCSRCPVELKCPKIGVKRSR